MTSLCRLIRKTAAPRETYPVRSEAQGLSVSSPQADEAAQEGNEAETRIKQAYQAGHDAGYAACREAFAAQAAAAVGDFKSMVEDVVSQRRRLVKESEEAVLRVACDIARRVVGRSAEIKEDIILEVVRNALEHMKDNHNVTIRVNPRDCEVLKQNEAVWLGSAREDGIRINEDARIKPGGCLIEGDSGSVEAQIDRQIDVIEKALLEGCK